MKQITPQDSVIITYHDTQDNEIHQALCQGVPRAIEQGNLAVTMGKAASFRVLDVVYNSKYKV